MNTCEFGDSTPNRFAPLFKIHQSLLFASMLPRKLEIEGTLSVIFFHLFSSFSDVGK